MGNRFLDFFSRMQLLFVLYFLLCNFIYPYVVVACCSMHVQLLKKFLENFYMWTSRFATNMCVRWDKCNPKNYETTNYPWIHRYISFYKKIFPMSSLYDRCVALSSIALGFSKIILSSLILIHGYIYLFCESFAAWLGLFTDDGQCVGAWRFVVKSSGIFRKP